ncbi:MAG: DUF4124 domain-containing protein [Woeseiaceae bacterium]|jgi:hypothetical protein|nr:DUF4124 domain-containing protein [Woeseiaceae bacterium]
MKWQKGAAASILTLAASGIAFAGDIYKWVDEDGHVHYGDKPVGAQSERMAIQSTPTDPARIAAQTQARAAARMEAREAEAAAAAEEPSEEALRAMALERREACEKARADMQRMVGARHLYREDDSGERVYLDEAEMQVARERAENQVSEFCG